MSDFESFLLRILLQLVVIIGAARLGAALFSRLGQPHVVGEILAGLILGPSILGRLSPQFLQQVFPPETGTTFHVLSELGLVLLMFLIGLEFDFSHLRHIGHTAAGVALAGIVIPFGLGAALAWQIHSTVAPDVHRTGFVLLMAVALSITAIPILGRIMVEFGIQRTRLGALTITAAAIDDALGWILLAAVSAVVRGSFQWSSVLTMLLLIVGFLLIVWQGVRPLVCWALRRGWLLTDGELSVGGLSAVLVLILLTAAATNAIGVFSILGPFVLGAALSDQRLLGQAVSERLRPLVAAFFLPIFFTYTGLRTDIGSLDGLVLWGIAGIVLLTAIAGKMLGCGIAARLGGMSWPEAGCVAVMMNTRALMGLIAVNLGRQMGLVPDSVFCMLVLMALVTTLTTAPLLRRLLPYATEAVPAKLAA